MPIAQIHRRDPGSLEHWDFIQNDCKSSALELVGQSQLELQEDRDAPKNSSVA